jgi:hypothetical protein
VKREIALFCEVLPPPSQRDREAIMSALARIVKKVLHLTARGFSVRLTNDQHVRVEVFF